VLASRYGVAREKLRVVHNAIDARAPARVWSVEESEPLVLFAGRITSQKGPEYFVMRRRASRPRCQQSEFAV
jgi:hypothetical protein